MNADYLNSAKQQFQYYKQLGDKMMAQLSDEQLYWQYNDAEGVDTNIAEGVDDDAEGVDTNIAEGVDNDAEGMNEHSRAVITERWELGWACLFTALDAIN
jgi:hypothetical protein